jgi:hydrogenase/urease accessory protein HupE
VLSCFIALHANAHEVRPAYLELTEKSDGNFSVLWKVPLRGDARPPIAPQFPESWREVSPPVGALSPGAILERWTIEPDAEGIDNATVAIAGLGSTMMDTLVRVQRADGTTHEGLVRPRAPTYTIPARDSVGRIAWTYLVLGIEHILFGIDHLLFVLALLLITSGTWRLVKTVTAFTVAHSITLSAAVLGFVNVPSAPVEAIIALSILFLAVELVHVHYGRESLAQRKPWLVSFAFGLLHGFGFAGALSAVGLPQSSIPVALLQFNVGVELGQLAFVAVVLLFCAGLNRIRLAWPTWMRLGPAYAIGSVAAFWTLQRVASFWE